MVFFQVFKKYEVLATQDETKRQKILKSKETQTSRETIIILIFIK